MAGLIPQHFIDELIARADIVEVIGSRVPLKKAGKEFKACCPFHGEKTPSFTVSQAKQFYHCFGCGAHGTAIGFLMEYDKLGFVEAVEELASRVGLDVPREAGAKRESSGDDLYEVLGRAAQFFRDSLKDNARAIEYLKKRGLDEDTALRFGIGYALDSWNALLKRFGVNDAARRKLLAAGLIIERSGAGARDSDGGFYDRFRDRIMFPIRDARGRVIAFGGRIIDAGEPKYLNSPETSVFHKGKELYGLYEARQSRQALTRLLIVEGYMDVVRLHQAGVTYALATLGTATTSEHLHRIFRLTAEVVFCFDGDRAGRAAAWRALENALPEAREGRQIKFMFLPEGHDPDSLVGEEGREAFEKRFASALPLSEYLVEQLASQVALEHIDGRARLAELAKPLLRRIPGGVYQELLIDRLAKQVGMSSAKLAALLLEPAEAAKSRSTAKTTAKPALNVGRGSLVRQAITLLLNHPDAAKAITGADELSQSAQPGAPLLAQLISELKTRPALNKAVVVERWRDRPEGVHLDKLAAAECLVTDAKAAARDIQMTVDRLRSEAGPSKRTDELLRKAGESGLTSQEKLELQRLLAERGGRSTARSKG
ncbi:MAG TPA: DNA primase [Steroidobacteraceae bacterium]|nr:DNA primase [Steroidobacteraceae bacterium]